MPSSGLGVPRSKKVGAFQFEDMISWGSTAAVSASGVSGVEKGVKEMLIVTAVVCDPGGQKRRTKLRLCLSESVLAVELLNKYSKQYCTDDEKWEKMCAKMGHRQRASVINFRFEQAAMTSKDLVA